MTTNSRMLNVADPTELAKVNVTLFALQAESILGRRADAGHLDGLTAWVRSKGAIYVLRPSTATPDGDIVVEPIVGVTGLLWERLTGLAGGTFAAGHIAITGEILGNPMNIASSSLVAPFSGTYLIVLSEGIEADDVAWTATIQFSAVTGAVPYVTQTSPTTLTVQCSNFAGPVDASFYLVGTRTAI